MKTIGPPNKVPYPSETPDWMVFLAGSIEMGAAVDWQKEVIKKLDDLDVTLLNPRRDDWDKSWNQDPVEGPFREQVLWELSSIAKATQVFHDCETLPYRSNVHAHYWDLKTLPNETKTKMWLYHYADKIPTFKEDGFQGFVEKGQEFDL